MPEHVWIWVGRTGDGAELYRCERDDCRKYIKDGQQDPPCGGGPAAGELDATQQ